MRATLFLVLTAAVLALAGEAAGAETGPQGVEDALGAALGPQDYAATGPTPGVRVAREGGRTVMRFDDRAAARYRRLAKRRLLLSCSAAPDPQAQNVVTEPTTRLLRAPARRSAFHPALPAADVCTVGVAETISIGDERLTVATPVASVGLTERGAVFLDRSVTAQRLIFTSLRARLRDTERPFPATAELVRRAGGVTVALDGPEAPPPPAPAVGAWSNGTDHMVLRAVTTMGYSMYIEFRGDVQTTNTNVWADQIQLII